MYSCIKPDLLESIYTANNISLTSDNSRESRTVVMFDLVGSTSLKLNQGHDAAMQTILRHNQICRKFVKEFSGTIIKELGDGVLAMFSDVENACLCAIHFVESITSLDFQTKISIATGKIEITNIDDTLDIFGSVVDLCASLEKFAFPNQILIDSVTHSTVLTYLKNYDDIEISHAMEAVLKGHSGKKKLFEIACTSNGLKNCLNIPFQINEDGRLSIDDKVSFISNAKSEIIELGVRLREFTSYFGSRNPTEFKEPVLNLLEKDVVLKCYALDGEWALNNLPISDYEAKYYREIPDTLNQLNDFKKEVLDKELPGKVEIYTYQHIPMFHVQCIDGDSSEGRMTLSNYLTGIKRSQCPVIQFSRHGHPKLFKTYWNSINEIKKNSKAWVES